MSNFNWREMYEEDPVGTQALLAQQAAAAEAQRVVEQQVGPLLQQAYQNGAQQNEELVNGQIEQAYYAADAALSANYGADWVESRDAIVQMVNDDPSLLPNESRFSAQAMADRLELLLKATREDHRQARQAEAFDRIKNARADTYADLHVRRNKG